MVAVALLRVDARGPGVEQAWQHQAAATPIAMSTCPSWSWCSLPQTSPKIARCLVCVDLSDWQALAFW